MKTSALVTSALLVLHTVAAALDVVPAVQAWTPAEGVFDAKGTGMHLAAADAAALMPVAEAFRRDLAAAGCGEWTIASRDNPGSNRAFVLMLDHDGVFAKEPEGYFINIGKDAVVVKGTTPTGVFYGTRTLLQLLARNPAKPTLPCGEIRDAPQYRHRMLMLDVGRKPFPLPVLKDYLRLMAWYKMNELHLHLSDEAFGGLYTGFRVQCDTFPGLASKDLHYTKPELRELQDFARGLGITITPEIDMPGHARCFTDYWPELCLKGHPNYLDVTNPQAIERMKALLDEMIPIFDAPDFHIGTDEYRVSGTPEEKVKLHEAFRQFINTINAHIHSRGKNTRIWSGFEHMLGTTQIDPTVTIDMWETDDARSQIARGHKIINSNHGRTYIVPGAHYYGVNNAGIYNSWEPWMVSGDMAKNPAKDDPHLLGGKLHVWNDQGPTGYTLTEIAHLTLPSLQAFAEKLWGTKGSQDYSEFQPRAALTVPVPGVTMFDRLPAKDDSGLVLEVPGEAVLAATDSVLHLPFDGEPRRDLEWPWTLTFEACKTAQTDKRGVILSSNLAEICSDFSRPEDQKTKDANGKEIKTTVTRRGLGVVRAAGSPGADPASARVANDVSRVYGDPLPLDQWVTVTIVGDRRRTTAFVNGVKVGETGEQALCPLLRLGSPTGNSFVGKIRNLRAHNRAFSPKEIGRAAGLDMPDNLAAKRPATASASDAAHGLTPEKLTDADPGTRWSSGMTGAPQWVAVDLGEPTGFNAMSIAWENAQAGEVEVQVSDDGQDWRTVATHTVTGPASDIRFPPVLARHARLLLAKPATQWGYSIWEWEVLSRRP